MEENTNVNCEILSFSENSPESGQESLMLDWMKHVWEEAEQKPVPVHAPLTDNGDEDDDEVCIPTDLNLNKSTVNNSDVKPISKSDLSEAQSSTTVERCVAVSSDFNQISVKEEPTDELYCGVEVDVNFGMGRNSDCAFPSTSGEDLQVGINEMYHSDGNVHEYICVVCNELFPTSEELEEHAVSHGSESFPSQSCTQTLPSDLQNHILVHKGLKHFKCKVCSKRYSSRHSLRIHLKIHDKYSNFHCGICEQRFRCKRYLKDHMLSHQSEKAFSCGVCSKKFSFAARLRSHMMCHMQHRPYKCRLCGKTFKTRTVRRKHELRHSAENRSQCDICNKFVTSLTNHMTVHTGSGNNMCDVCGKAFVSKWRLEEHKVEHTGARPWQCKECGQEFSAMSALKRHIYRMHAVEKSFRCSVCEKAFSRECLLNEHLRKTHLAKNTVKCFVCSECKKEYRSKQALMDHVALHKSGRSFSCSICKILCFTQNQLDKHMTKHPTVMRKEILKASQEEDFKDISKEDMESVLPASTDQWETGFCMICGKSCKTDSKLSVHMRSRHPGQKPFKCHQCDQAFLVHQHLRLHIDKKH